MAYDKTGLWKGLVDTQSGRGLPWRGVVRVGPGLGWAWSLKGKDVACDRTDLCEGLGLDRGGVIRTRGRGLVEGRGLRRAGGCACAWRSFFLGLSRVSPRCLGFPGGMAEPDELAWLAENGFAEDDAPPGEP